MNNFNIVGRLTRDSELSYTKENKAVTRMDVAVRNGKDNATFIPVKVFGKMAENICKYCTKGSQLAITGSIYNNNYTDKEGNKHYEFSFIGNTIEFLTSKTNDTQKETKKETVDNTQVYAEFGDLTEIKDEDIAF